ncbi:BTB/POZ domain-containing protein 6 [Aphelenchoides avenae]|nr:BTB/POZ domain-containing protein 6 [Aphelenchus avenae]
MQPPCAALYLKDHLSDVTFVVPDSHKKGDCRIPAHTLLICAPSEPFVAMFFGSFGKPPEVEITDAESEDFKSFLRYFYYGTAELTDKNVFRVLYLAEKYLVEDLVKQCASHIAKLTLDATSAMHLFIEAQCCSRVPDKLWSALEDFTASAMESPEFLLLNRTNLRKFLRRDKLRAHEVAVYARLKAWAEHQLRQSDPEKPVTDARIRDYLGDDIWLVRYAQMTVGEFTNCLSGDDCLTAEEKHDVELYLNWNPKMREQVKQRLPLLNTNPRQFAPPRANSWRDWPIIRTFFGHHDPSRKIHGVTIKTLVPGDGRNFPRSGQRVRVMQEMSWIDKKEHCALLNGKDFRRGTELAILTMSIGEKARITVSLDLYAQDSEEWLRLYAEGKKSFCCVVQLLSIE